MSSALVLNTIAADLIFVWAAWCVLSKKVNDGIVGKVIFSALSIAAFAVFSSGIQGKFNQPAEVAMNVSVAGLAIRHFWMRHYWADIRKIIFPSYRPMRRSTDNKP